MEKIFSIFIALSICFVLKAQNEGKNIIKTNLSAFATKGYSLQYERKISKRLTAALNYSAIPKSKIAFQSIIEDAIEDPDVQVGSFLLGTSIFTPEIRWYIGRKGAMRGFYLAPYARISTYDMQVPVSFNSGTSKRTALFDGKLNNTTGGLMLGSQFQLSNRLYLDWWIIGGSIGGASGNLIAATSLNTAEQQSLRDALKNVDVPFTSIEYTVNSNGATINTTGSMAGVRGLGLNLGIRF
jgi:hypothetical protein